MAFTLPETNSKNTWKMDGLKTMKSPFGIRPIFRGRHVSFREASWVVSTQLKHITQLGWFHISPNRDENQQYLKLPPPRRVVHDPYQPFLARVSLAWPRFNCAGADNWNSATDSGTSRISTAWNCTRVDLGGPQRWFFRREVGQGFIDLHIKIHYTNSTPTKVV